MANKDKKNKTSFDYGNTAAEKWTFEMTRDFFEKALEIAKRDDVFHLSTIAVELDTYHEIFAYLLQKFPEFNTEKKKIDSLLLNRLQKYGLLGQTNAMFTKFHISSNYGWSEKTETKSEVTSVVEFSKYTDEELEKLKRKFEK